MAAMTKRLLINFSVLYLVSQVPFTIEVTIINNDPLALVSTAIPGMTLAYSFVSKLERFAPKKFLTGLLLGRN
jgi:hypothetical protein